MAAEVYLRVYILAHLIYLCVQLCTLCKQVKVSKPKVCSNDIKLNKRPYKYNYWLFVPMHYSSKGYVSYILCHVYSCDTNCLSWRNGMLISLTYMQTRSALFTMRYVFIFYIIYYNEATIFCVYNSALVTLLTDAVCELLVLLHFYYYYY